jgi:hypothetical protein
MLQKFGSIISVSQSKIQAHSVVTMERPRFSDEVRDPIELYIDFIVSDSEIGKHGGTSELLSIIITVSSQSS